MLNDSICAMPICAGLVSKVFCYKSLGTIKATRFNNNTTKNDNIKAPHYIISNCINIVSNLLSLNGLNHLWTVKP